MKQKNTPMSAAHKVKNNNVTKNVSSKNIHQEPTQLSFWYYLIPPALFTFITTIMYYPSLRYPFQFDDLANISKKFIIRYDNPLMRWWTNSRWMGDGINRINYLMGRFDPFYYRATNLLIHLLAGILLFFLILTLCRSLLKKPFFATNALLIASTTAMLFLLHPVQTQTVSYVIQGRIEGLASLFVIATVYFFTQFFNARRQLIKWGSFMLFFLCGLFSWGTKEIVIVTPFLLLLVDWFFLAQEEWTIFKKHLWVHGLFNIFYFGLMFHYFGISFVQDAVSLRSVTGNNRGNIITDNPFEAITPFNFFISQFRVVLHYITMFVWPFGISVEYDWKLQTSIFSYHVIFPFVMLCTFFFYALRTAIKKELSFFAFGLFWFFVCVAPRSSFIPSPELVFDYKTYLASVGILFILAVVLTFLIMKIYAYFATSSWTQFMKEKQILTQHNALLAILVIFAIPIGMSARLRNRIWASNLNFWEDTVKKAPLKARAHNNYGVALSEIGRVDESIQEYHKAIELDRFYQDPLSNLAVAYSMKKETDKAIESLKKAIQMNPNYAEAYNNIGSLYIEKQRYEESEKALCKAVAIRPYYGKAYFNLARLYEIKNQPEKVWAYLKKASEGDLDVPHVFARLGLSSLQLQKYSDAVQAFEKAIERGLVNNQIWFQLANAYFMLEQHDKAQTIYQRLAVDHPSDKRFIYNLAETLFTKKEYTQALTLFEKVIKMPNAYPQAHLRIAGCLEKMKKVDQAKEYLNKLLTFKAPEEFIKVVKNEISRMTLQEKMEQGNGSIRLSDLKQAIASRE